MPATVDIDTMNQRSSWWGIKRSVTYTGQHSFAPSTKIFLLNFLRSLFVLLRIVLREKPPPQPCTPSPFSPALVVAVYGQTTYAPSSVGSSSASPVTSTQGSASVTSTAAPATTTSAAATTMGAAATTMGAAATTMGAAATTSYTTAGSSAGPSSASPVTSTQGPASVTSTASATTQAPAATTTMGSSGGYGRK